MKRLVALMLGVCALLVAGCAPASAPASSSDQEVKDVRIAFAAAVPDVQEFFLYAVQKELGYYEDENLNVTASQTGSGGSTAAIQTVVSGSVDIANSVAPNTIAAVSKGVPVRAFARIQSHWTWHTVVAPDSSVQDLSDLKGKKVGVVSLASISYPYARGAMSLSKVNPDDVEYVPVGSGIPAFKALEEGKVDALTYWSAGLVTARGAGFEFRDLKNPDYFNDMPSATWVARADALKKDPEKFAAFARAQYRGVVFALENPEEAVRIGYKHFPDLLPSPANYDKQFAIDVAALKVEVAEQVKDAEDPSTWTAWGGVTEQEWDTAQEFTIMSGEISEKQPLEKIWDGSLVDSINDGMDVESIIKEAKSNEG